MATLEKEVIRILKENGCTFVRHGKGDHDIWRSPVNNQNIVVDGTIKSKFTANAIMKEAGIQYKF